MSTNTDQFVNAARALLARGFVVFPADHPGQRKCIGAHQAVPCDGQRGKHPAVAWSTWNVVTSKMIDTHWRRRGGLANPAVSCGPSDLVVLDDDGDLDKWAATYGLTLPETYTVTTGRGRHLYYRWDHTVEKIGNVDFPDFHMDVRGQGGLVIGEGAQHVSGAIYTGNGIEVVDLPAEVARVLLGHQNRHKAPAPTATWEVSPSSPGEDPNTARIGFKKRHPALIAYAGRLRSLGLDYTEAVTVFKQRWLLCEQPTGIIPEATFHSPDCPYPVTWDEAEAKLKDVYERYAAGDSDGDRAPLEGAVQHQLTVLRVRQEAKRRLDAEENPPALLPPVKSLDALLAEPDEPSRFRIDNLAPLGGKVMVSAQYKAGKTTMVTNLLRALADNTPFLGSFDITTPAERLVLVDDELGENMLRLWLREQGIGNTAAVVDTVALRGKLSSFNPMDDRNRDQWATRWRDLGVDYLVLDCLRPVLDAHGLDENHDAGTFLVAFDALLEEAGIKDSLTVHHMGHANERSRGDSRLQDWPDAIWKMMRESEEPDSARYFSAFGRDVKVPEGRLSYDEHTRRLTYANGTRTDARLDKARADVIELLVAAQAKGAKPNGTAIENTLVPPHNQKSLRQAVAALVRAGVVAVDDGPRNSKLHYIAHPCAQCRLPVVTGRERHESCPQDAEEALIP